MVQLLTHHENEAKVYCHFYILNMMLISLCNNTELLISRKDKYYSLSQVILNMKYLKYYIKWTTVCQIVSAT